MTRLSRSFCGVDGMKEAASPSRADHLLSCRYSTGDGKVFRMRQIVLVIAVAVAALPALAHEPCFWSISGHATALDGDTIALHNNDEEASEIGPFHYFIKLAGIDAPEEDQKCPNGDPEMLYCGKKAYEFLLTLAISGPVSCITLPSIHQEGKKDDVHMSAMCFATYDGKPLDLARAMVVTGYALDNPMRSPYYGHEEKMARRGRVGMHNATFVEPWRWRAGERAAGE